MTTPVSFELAKLLKEKGFDEQNLTIYQDGEVLLLRSTISNSQFMTSRNYTAPTLAEVVMWLYEKHSLWILPIPTVTGHFAYKILDVQLDPENEIERPPYTGVSAMDYNLPTEAYEAAIEDCLKNII